MHVIDLPGVFGYYREHFHRKSLVDLVAEIFFIVNKSLRL
jgi:hypothetical protein